MHRRNTLTILTVTILLVILFSSSHPFTVTAATTTIYIDPAATIVVYEPEKTVTVNISIADVTDLVGWEFKLYYNATVLNGTTINEGPFLKSGGNTFFAVIEFVENATHGFAWVTCVGDTGTHGSGVLANITFATKALGTSFLKLTDTKLLNSQVAYITHNTVDGTITVTSPPNASFTHSPPSPTIDTTVTFDASASTPNGGYITNYSWDFGDLNTTSTPNPTITHVYTAEGTYNVTLTITDSEGLTDSTWQLIEVTIPTNHDVAIISVTPYTNVAYQGWMININVTAENQGDYTETFNVTAYYNTSLIGIQTITNLNPGNQATITFTWNTTEVTPCQNYTIKAEADTIPGETDTTDNSLTDGTVKIKMPGDANGDKKVDWQDLLIFARAYGSFQGEPAYVPEADFNSDGKIDWKDLLIFARNYGKTC